MMAEVSGEGVPGEAVETGALSPYPLHGDQNGWGKVGELLVSEKGML